MSLILNGDTGISAVDGTASVPALVGNDTNTGIYFPAADTIGFSEGGVQVGEFDSSANFKFNSGYGSVATAYGCRAWVNFNGTGTPAITASGNVTSITDGGTGIYTVVFSNAMPDANYSLSGTALGTSNGCISATSPTFSTGSCSFNTVSNANVAYDPTIVSVAIFR
jgi:hypothetical protein